METRVHKPGLRQDKSASAAAEARWQTQWYKQRVVDDWSVGYSRGQGAWQNPENTEDKRPNLRAFICCIYNIWILKS